MRNADRKPPRVPGLRQRLGFTLGKLCEVEIAMRQQSIFQVGAVNLTFMNLGDAPDDERNLRVEVLR